MDIFLSINNREEVIQLPMIPESFQVEYGNNNQVFTTISKGELNLIGNQGLKSLSIDSFFPNRDYSYAKSRAYSGDEFVETIEAWNKRRVPIRIVITNSEGREIINLAVAIESFNYGYDKAGDVLYSLALKEFRMLG